MNPNRIRVISICAIWSQGGRILVFEAFDSVKGTFYYRPLGGGIEPGETSEATAVREVREEIGLDITDLSLLGVLENVFQLQGAPFHEIVFVYEGRFRDESVENREEFIVEEDNGDRLRGVWRELNSFDANRRLVPEGLLALLVRNVVYHITTRPAIDAAATNSQEYIPETFGAEGFIHCSYAHQVAAVANRRFTGRADLILLEIDRARLRCPVLDENLEGGLELFPHIYGHLPTSAITRIHDFPCDAAGRFTLPATINDVRGLRAR
jgi:uncharacterized protein (DUF952 family)/8-oxo-dGTP pyrophosphatase MutT (NUDIX family)